MNKIMKFLRDYAEDFLISAGVVLINIATYQIHTTAGLYCTGLSLVAVGGLLARMARQPPGGR